MKSDTLQLSSLYWQKELIVLSSTVTVQFRMERMLKEQLDAMLSDMGLTISTAMNLYAKAIVRDERIPFEIRANKKPTREKFLSLAGKIDIDENAIAALREGSLV